MYETHKLLEILIDLFLKVFGKIEWVLILYFICMATDYISGTLVAIKTKKWKLGKSAFGVWKKMGSTFAVIAGAILDILIYTIRQHVNVNIFNLFEGYTPIFCCLILTWYILTELGSILENTKKLGAPVPDFLLSGVIHLKGNINKSSKDTTGKNSKKK